MLFPFFLVAPKFHGRTGDSRTGMQKCKVVYRAP
jgi:hypothetical protein